ncbi:MAG: carboxypeptidase-like regulatory domain-containing protein [Bacteroidia bacterium]
MKKFATILMLCISSFAIAQNNKDLVQFTGVTVTGDSLLGVPYVIVKVKGSNHGTITDYYGFFSFVAHLGDTIEFSSVGYHKARYIIPDTLRENKYSLIQVLNIDTVNLPTATVYPWPTKDEFKQAFVNLQLPDDDYTRARRSLDKNNLDAIAMNLPPDASLNYKYSQNERTSQLYYAGQLPQNTLLNPIAWAKFIQAWKSGAFKRKDK